MFIPCPSTFVVLSITLDRVGHGFGVSMGIAVTLRVIIRILLVSFGWAIFFTAGVSLLTDGAVLRRLDIGVYTLLTVFSYIGAFFTAITVNAIVRKSNRILAVVASILAFIAMFFVIQFVSASLFDVLVAPIDGSIDINYDSILPPDDELDI